MEKSDLRKELKRLYSPKERPELVDVPELSYITYTGRGEPGGAAYTESLNALYSSVYTLMTLEGLWWWDDPSIVNLADAPPKQPWNWTSMIVVPDFVTAEMLEEVKPDLIKKKGKAVEKVRLERIHAGLCAQILHVGPYSDEPRSVKLLHGFMAERGLKLRGRHHEVYMSDPRRTPPEKWRTIIRLPVEA